MSQPKKKIPVPGNQRVVGKGIRSRSYVVGDWSIDPEAVGNEKLAFELYISILKDNAMKTLGGAGLPTDPTRVYTVPEGEAIPIISKTEEELKIILSRFPKGIPGLRLHEFVDYRGYPERESLEWYSAAFLVLLWGIQQIIDDADIKLVKVFELGTLVTEAVELGFFKKAGRAPRKRRRIPDFGALSRFLVRQNRTGTARELFEAIPEDEEILFADYKFYRANERVRAFMKVDGRWIEAKQSLNYNSFRKKVTQAKRLLSR